MKKEKTNRLTVVYRKVKEVYTAYVEEIPGVNTQGSDLKGINRRCIKGKEKT